MQRIVFLDRATVKGNLRKPNFPHEWVDFEFTAPDEVTDRLAGAAIAITNKVPLRQSVLLQLPQLKLVAVAATGFDCVDAAYARTRGITVTNVPGYAQYSVPEHVFMLILALRRNLIPYDHAVQQGRWSASPFFSLLDYPLADLRGSTLGIIGYGAIAKEVETIARAFGMRILISERKGAGSARPERHTFEEVLRRSDVISLHAPLTVETRGLIGAAELKLMKPGAILINTARGALIDEAALGSALRAGTIGGAGLDVLAQEPPRLDHPLLEHTVPNLIVTPHIAWASRQAVDRMTGELISTLEAFVDGKPKNVVNA